MVESNDLQNHYYTSQVRILSPTHSSTVIGDRLHSGCRHLCEFESHLLYKLFEIQLVVNQLALGCRIWNADNGGSSSLY